MESDNSLRLEDFDSFMMNLATPKTKPRSEKIPTPPKEASSSSGSSGAGVAAPLSDLHTPTARVPMAKKAGFPSTNAVMQPASLLAKALAPAGPPAPVPAMPVSGVAPLAKAATGANALPPKAASPTPVIVPVALAACAAKPQPPAPAASAPVAPAAGAAKPQPPAPAASTSVAPTTGAGKAPPPTHVSSAAGTLASGAALPPPPKTASLARAAPAPLHPEPKAACPTAVGPAGGSAMPAQPAVPNAMVPTESDAMAGTSAPSDTISIKSHRAAYMSMIRAFTNPAKPVTEQMLQIFTQGGPAKHDLLVKWVQTNGDLEHISFDLIKDNDLVLLLV